MKAKKRNIVVVNKYWECDPVCWVLTNLYLKENKQFPIDWNKDGKTRMSFEGYPSFGPVKPADIQKSKPRLIFENESSVTEIWCISDLLSLSPPDMQSNSKEKMRLMPMIFDYRYSADIETTLNQVIAVGTASSGPGVTPQSPVFNTDNINGSVVIGSNVFLHDGRDNSGPDNFEFDGWDQILRSGNTEFINQFSQKNFEEASILFQIPPLNKGKSLNLYTDQKFIALGDVNVSNYKHYPEKDEETGREFQHRYPDEKDNGVSVETTHGLIYLTARTYLNQQAPPFIFVSGIVDRFTLFGDDVAPQEYAQNIAGAHNAGIAVALLLSELT